jgi:hypothetical protein
MATALASASVATSTIGTTATAPDLTNWDSAFAVAAEPAPPLASVLDTKVAPLDWTGSLLADLTLE